MPNDAKLGMVVGMGLVILVAVLFYRKELPAQGGSTPANAVGTAGLSVLPSADSLRRHTVRDGETLGHLAKYYYGDATRHELLRSANLPQLRTQEEPPTGTILIIPEGTLMTKP